MLRGSADGTRVRRPQREHILPRLCRVRRERFATVLHEALIAWTHQGQAGPPHLAAIRRRSRRGRNRSGRAESEKAQGQAGSAQEGKPVQPKEKVQPKEEKRLDRRSVCRRPDAGRLPTACNVGSKRNARATRRAGLATSCTSTPRTATFPCRASDVGRRCTIARWRYRWRR